MVLAERMASSKIMCTACRSATWKNEARMKTTQMQLHGQCRRQGGGMIGPNSKAADAPPRPVKSTLANVNPPVRSVDWNGKQDDR